MYVSYHSALLGVGLSFTVSALDIHTGLKIRAHLRSSLALQGEITLKGTELLDVEFGIPQSRLQLLEYKYINNMLHIDK